MKVSRAARIALLFLAAFLFQTDRFMALAATPPAGGCLYALDSSADRALLIAGAQSVYTACGVVVESSASDGYEMGGSDTMPAAIAPIDAISHNSVEANRRPENEQVESVHHMGNSTAIAYGMALGST
jgi:hypothetical protein